MVWVRKLPRITHSKRMTDYTDVKRIREELPTIRELSDGNAFLNTDPVITFGLLVIRPD